MTLDELTTALREQLVPEGASRIAGLLVAPDVWAKLAADLPRSEKPARVSWHVTVDKWLPAGAIVPVDADGKPLLKADLT